MQPATRPGSVDDIRGIHDEAMSSFSGPPSIHPAPSSTRCESDETNDFDSQDFVPDRKRPIAHRWNIIPCILFVLVLAASAFYFYVRFTTLRGAYTIFILSVELLGLTSFLPYATLLTRGVYPTGTPGLPSATLDEQREDAMLISCGQQGLDTRFDIKVLVPCYKEPLEVVQATVLAALEAHLPLGARRTVYLCDDGNDPYKRAFISQLGDDARYITGRVRKPGEINGKSNNLNNALRTIYAEFPKGESGEADWTHISHKDVVVVFDADMKAKPDFFLKTLEVMMDADLALCLTPQAFHNISPEADLFNSINKQFWDYWLPGAFGWGYIACTGTNFVIRARALCHCGWFPTRTITEDYMLGMQLKKRGYSATYLLQHLAEGEAPEEIRNVLQQRSRWTKGHFQVFFSPDSPLVTPGLPFFQRLWYAYAAWAPICTAITVPTFMLVPFMSIAAGLHPVTLSFDFVLASSLYFGALLSVQFYVRSWADLRMMWYVNVSNTLLSFTYAKAFFNTMLSKIGMKRTMFKVTAKTGTAGSAPPPPLPLAAAPSAAAAAGSPAGEAQLLSPPLKRSSRPHYHAPRHTPQLSTIPSGDLGPLVPAHALAPAGPRAGRHDHVSSFAHNASGAGYAPAYDADADTDATPGRLTRDQATPATPRYHCAHPHAVPSNSNPTTPLTAVRRRVSVCSEYGNNAGLPQTPAHLNNPHSPASPSHLLLSTHSTLASSASSGALDTAAAHGQDARKHGKPLRHPSAKHLHKGSDTLPAEFCLPLHSPTSTTTSAKDHQQQQQQQQAQGVDASAGQQQQQQTKPPSRVRRAWAWLRSSFTPQHIKDFDQMTDPIVLGLMLAFCLATAALGVWQLAAGGGGQSRARFELGSPMSGSPFLIVATLWALYNAIAPYLFVHYWFSHGPTFKAAAKWLAIISALLLVGAMATIWMLVPREVDVEDPLDSALHHLYPSAIAKDTNTNYAFVTGVVPAAAALPAGIPLSSIDLSGGLLVSDNAKYAMPMSYTVATLAWSLLQSPEAYRQGGRREALLGVVRAGADYLMRCNLNPTDPANPVFVAQVGDGADYLALGEPGYDPVAAGKRWAAPWQDPQLVGTAARPVWLLTKDARGADLLAGAAAALAAAAAATRGDDPAFASAALAHARYLYAFATAGADGPGGPQSYCAHVPCTAGVNLTRTVVAKPASLPLIPVQQREGQPVCYYVDWESSTCRFSYSLAKCIQLKEEDGYEVYTSKMGCCNRMYETKSWADTFTKSQGICAVPEQQWQCYVPDIAQRTCLEVSLDQQTGAGCSGRGMEVFATPLACCNYLSRTAIIDNAAGKAGSGMCARASSTTPPGSTTGSTTPATAAQCYIPSVSNATCLLGVGAECAAFGAETAFDAPTACCNRLMAMFKEVGFAVAPSVAALAAEPSGTQTFIVPRGVCTLTQDPAPAATPAAAPPPAATPAAAAARRRSLAGGSSSATTTSARQLLGDSTPPSATSSSATGAGGDWVVPHLDVSSACSAGGCREMGLVVAANASLFNSSSVLDDLAWGGAWLYIATLEPKYLGMSQRFLQRHYKEEATEHALVTNPALYRPSWDNLAWATNALLAKLSHKAASSTAASATSSSGSSSSSAASSADESVFSGRLRGVLRKWLFAGAVKGEDVDSIRGTSSAPSTGSSGSSASSSSSSLTAALPLATTASSSLQLPISTTQDDRRLHPRLESFFDAPSNESYLVVPSCQPTAAYESSCGDGIDNDCDGFIDQHDLDCGLFPIMYTPHQMAWSQGDAPLPTTAAAAFLALTYADIAPTPAAAGKLRCWALSQLSYMLGATQGTRSMVVGVGANPPTRVRHMASSCAATGSASNSGASSSSSSLWGSRRSRRALLQLQGNDEAAEAAAASAAAAAELAEADGDADDDDAAVCDWSSGFYPDLPNPQLDLIKGALVWGPLREDDNYQDSRSYDGSVVTLHDNAPFHAALAALLQSGTTLRSCELEHGVVQRYFLDRDEI